MDERERRKEQRKKELEEKRRRLKELKNKNRLDLSSSPSQDVDSKIDLASIDNVHDLLKTLEQRKIPAPADVVPSAKTIIQDNIIMSTSESNPSVNEKLVQPSPRKVALSIQLNVVVHDIAPKEVEMYSKGTQTADNVEETENSGDQPTSEITNPTSTVKSLHAQKPSKEQVATAETAESVETPLQEEEPQAPSTKDLSETQRKHIVASEDFVQFFSRASRTLERAIKLADEFDVTRDYRSLPEERQSATAQVAPGQKVSLQLSLHDEHITKHRSVTDIAWSPKEEDLVVAAYSANEGAAYEPDGVVCLWSIQNLLNRAEAVFNCQSPVMASLFSKYNPTLVIGGCYSGQIVLWDRRSSRRTPVQRTPLSSIGHTHPVYGLAIVGTQNANNLLSLSTDGRMCLWTLESLHQPLEVLELRNKQSKSVTGGGNVAPTCLSVPPGEANEFFIGTEEAVVYQAYRHGSKSGVFEQFSGHKGPITGLDFHPAGGSVDFSHLFLTSSMDWSCKLWHKKDPSGPIHSFEDFGDYVYDIGWSPVHPALFATVDGTSTLSLWNLNVDVEATQMRAPGPGKALNSLSWSPGGRKVICGDSGGMLHLYDIPAELALSAPDEGLRMEDTLKDLMISSSHRNQAQGTELL